MKKLLEYIAENEAMAVVFATIGLVILVIVTIKAIQNAGLEKVRATVYKAFVYAENNFLHGENDEKFQYVVETAKNAIPFPFSLFITEELLRDVIQTWFDVCKDLLDDGRINKSGGKEE